MTSAIVSQLPTWHPLQHTGRPMPLMVGLKTVNLVIGFKRKKALDDGVSQERQTQWSWSDQGERRPGQRMVSR